MATWGRTYYPVNDEKNSVLYAEYEKLADAEDNTEIL